jgi:hypothetical protein
MHRRGMTGICRQIAVHGRGGAAGVLWLALLLGACSSGSQFGGPAASTPETAASSGGLSPITGLLSGSSAKGPQTTAGAPPNVDCPTVEIRRGAGTMAIGPSGDKSTMDLKYQVEFTRQARECSVVAGNMVMRIGLEGRVVVGPAGGPGRVDVPLRIAVVHETPSGGTRSIQTKFLVIPVVIGPGQGGAPFSYVEDALAFPMPTPVAQLDDYIAYVGFDPQTAQAQAKPAAPAKRPKPKPHPAASAD